MGRWAGEPAPRSRSFSRTTAWMPTANRSTQCSPNWRRRMAAEASDDETPEYLLADTHEVALFNPGEEDHDTIVLSGIDLVIPLELDIDGDPLQDDEVRLRSEDGYYDL